MSNAVTSGAITTSAGSTPTAFMLWLGIMFCRIMTWTDGITRPAPGDYLQRMPMKSFSSLAVTVGRKITKLQPLATSALAGTAVEQAAVDDGLLKLDDRQPQAEAD